MQAQNGSSVVVVNQRATGMWVAIIALFLLVGGLVGFFFLRDRTQPVTAAPVQVPLVAVQTNPTGLIIIDETGAILGKSPVLLKISSPMLLRARLGDETSAAFTVDGSNNDVRWDLSDWVGKINQAQQKVAAQAKVETPVEPADTKPEIEEDNDNDDAQASNKNRKRRSSRRRNRRNTEEVVDPVPAQVEEPETAVVTPPIVDEPKVKTPKIGTLDDNRPNIGVLGGDSPNVGTLDESGSIGTVD